MSAERSVPPPASRVVSWLAGCVIVGWLVAYNALRVTGSNPSDAALPALAVGAVGGAVVFAVGLVVVRRLAASGRVVAPAQGEIPPPDRRDAAQRDAVRFAWPALLALAALALVMGGVLAADWLSADAGDRPTTTLILAAWNVLAGLWIGDEALRLRGGEADGIDSLPLGCGLTAILAGVGLSRDLVVTGQVTLIVVAGVAGLLAGLAVWRLRGAHGLPVAGIAALVAAALSLILPLAL